MVEALIRKAIRRALEKGRPHEIDGIPQGQAALEVYPSDVSDTEKDFSTCEEWFCWAAFERLVAGKCAEVWLSSVATDLDSEPGRIVTEARGLDTLERAISLLEGTPRPPHAY